MSKTRIKWRVRDDHVDPIISSDGLVIGYEHSRSDPYTICMDPSDEKLYDFAGRVAIIVVILMVAAVIGMMIW